MTQASYSTVFYSMCDRPAKSTGLPRRLLFFLTPSTDLLGGRTFILVLKKLHYWYFNLIYDFYLFFVWIHCLIIGSLQPVTRYMLFDNYNYCFALKFVMLACMCICRPIACRRASWLSYSCLARKSNWFYGRSDVR